MKHLLGSLWVMLALVSCQSEPSSGAQMYEASELAETMRVIVDDFEGYRERAEAGKLTVEEVDAMLARHLSMATDEPTTPGDIQPSFEVFTQAYEGNLRGLRDLIEQGAGAEEQAAAFNHVLNTCVGCHQDHCPGPIPRIQKLKVAE